MFFTVSEICEVVGIHRNTFYKRTQRLAIVLKVVNGNKRLRKIDIKLIPAILEALEIKPQHVKIGFETPKKRYLSTLILNISTQKLN